LITSIVLLIVSLVAILLGAELFTNGIEWFGRKLQLAEGAVGSVLAAVGTALPETMIPIIAILFSKGSANHEIGIGAILGAPLMLSTLAFFVTGAAVFFFKARKRRSLKMHVDYIILGRDLRTFFIVYSVAIASSFLKFHWMKIIAAVFLLGAYAYYVRKTMTRECPVDEPEELHRLHFHRKEGHPRLRIIVSQVVAALMLIVGGADIFVKNLSFVALSSGIPALVLATIITPIATELPEKFNSVIWIRRKKDTLALGNISGAMVFQSSIPTAVGILFTNWVLTPQALAAAIITLAASIFAWAELTFKKRLSPYTLLSGIFFYAAYLVYTFVLAPTK
jgi:cation:H+ antiporter